MTPFSKWKTIGYAVAIFAAGGISGGALGIYETKREAGEPRERDMAVHLRDRLQNRLNLTPEELQKIDPILDKTIADLHAVRMDTVQRVNKIFEDSLAQISALITPEQKVKLDQLVKERREGMQQRVGRLREGPPRRRGMDGPP